MAVSLQRISSSADLLRDAPLRLYNIAIIFYLLACAVLVVNSLWLTARSIRKDIPERAEAASRKDLQDIKPGDRQAPL